MSHETAIKERRQSKRWNLKVSLRVFIANSDEFVGHVLDVSLHGIKMASERQFGEAEEMAFDLEIPGADGQWRRTFVTALSVYCIHDTSGDSFYTGFKFLQVEPESLLSLQQLIDEIASFT